MAADCSIVDISLDDFCIPDYIFNPDGVSVGAGDGGIEKCTFQNPSCPVVVFINSKSGGQLGGDLLQTYRSLLNRCQVFDLGEEPPDKVLHRLYLNLERFKYNGDQVAIKIYNSLRLIVAGGDGTAGWLLGVVSDLKLTRPPPIATVPLGTGNNLPFSFGWGKKNPGTDSDSVRAFLYQVMNASEMKIDSWHIVMRMKAPKEGGACEPIAPLELPHSLHAFHRVSNTDSLSKAGYHTYRGGFWNYFSMGMDAQVSYAFHSERKLYPEKFKRQIANQNTYLKLGCTQGWFCASLMHDSSRNIAKLTKVKIIKRPGQQWEDLPIPVSIRSIVCLNLPSFSGGLNPWGTLSPRASQDKKIMPAYVDDGLVEIVGFRNAWHGLTLLSSRGHGTRLAQAHRIRFEFHKGVAEETYMRIDGEPWKQPLPMNGETVVIEIAHLGQVSMLSAPNHPSKSINEEPSTPSTPNQVEPDYDSDEYEEKRKFGAAATFKFPKDIDIAQLS